jgi:hypothetical protein
MGYQKLDINYSLIPASIDGFTDMAVIGGAEETFLVINV